MVPRPLYILNLSWLKRKKYYHSKILTLFDSTQPLQYIRQSPLIHSLAVYLVYKKSRREGKSPLYYYISSSWLNPFSWFNRLSPVGKLSAHFLYAHAASAAPSLRVCLEKKVDLKHRGQKCANNRLIYYISNSVCGMMMPLLTIFRFYHINTAANTLRSSTIFQNFPLLPHPLIWKIIKIGPHSGDCAEKAMWKFEKSSKIIKILVFCELKKSGRWVGHLVPCYMNSIDKTIG